MNFESAKPNGGEKRTDGPGRPKQLRTTMEFDGMGEEGVSLFLERAWRGDGGSAEIQERVLRCVWNDEAFFYGD